MWQERLFREFLAIGHRALMARLAGTDIPDTTGLMTQLFEFGGFCGLTEKEITQRLLEPVKMSLRPAMKNPS